MKAFDYTDWHTKCTGVAVLSVGGRLLVWCPVCRVVSDLEAISKRCDYKESFKTGLERTQSAPRTVGLEG